ncbi:hypothetical protein ZHAS_00017835 [Anopheles sinensis]|uniref:Uncharacterized protein n=1 Tax=Anopheles sinensis TaxID=74873 RepID=A0A084WHX2_ANOSI|nr:hypothetical protein ZHAS_00017835 [Anopheles sinensis]
MFTCQCLNVSITVNDESFLSTTAHPVQETLKSDPNVPRRPVPPGGGGVGGSTTGIIDGKSRELACFFQEVSVHTNIAFITMSKHFQCK